MSYRCLWALAVGGLLIAAPASRAQQSLGLGPSEGALKFAQQVGKRFTVVCPASDGTRATVYGTDIYTADSPVCAAAIHAGVLQPGRAGAVSIDIGSGAKVFEGSTRNGVTTRSYGRWGTSYTFARGGVPGQITWQTVWSAIPMDFTEAVTLECPAGGAPSGGKLWGTGVYTKGSSVCVAAVHAGVITAEGGGVIVARRVPGQKTYPATNRFGIASERYDAYPDAFAVAAAPRAPTRPPTGSVAVAAGSGTATLPSASTLTRLDSALAPRALNVSARTPAIAALSWQPPLGTVPTGYDVYRSATSSGSVVKLNPAPLATTAFDDASGGLDSSHTYIYRVTANFEDGSSGEAQATFRPPAASNPTAVTATQQGADIIVSWTAVPNASWYGVAGVTQALWRQVRSPTTTAVYENLPPGHYVFTVGAYFEPGPTSTSIDLWPAATISFGVSYSSQQMDDARSKAAEAAQQAWESVMNLGR